MCIGSCKIHFVTLNSGISSHVLPMTAVEIKQLMSLLPFMIGQFVPENDVHWVNCVRLIQITHLVISPIASTQ
jgi:hypothetical protein